MENLGESRECVARMLVTMEDCKIGKLDHFSPFVEGGAVGLLRRFA